MSKAPGFLVKSPCGRHYFVPLEEVRQDYAACVRQMEGRRCTRAKALAHVDEQGAPALDTWFAEQWDWSDVMRSGQLVRQPSKREVERALNFYLAVDSPTPAECARPATYPL